MAQKFTVPITVKQLTTAGSDAITVYVDADTFARLKVEAGGRLVWGSGSGAGDVNLYRDAADVLRTDDTFKTPTLFVDNIEIDPTGAVTDHVLKYDGTKFISASVSFGGGGGSTTLDGLLDVTVPSPLTNDVLQYNGTAWVNVSASAVGATSLDGLSDVVITAPEEFQTLEYDGTTWVNKHASVVSYVRNAETTTLTTGTVVYLFGATGDHATVKRADKASDATSSKTVGLIGANIAASQNGPVITRGYVDGIDLSVGYAPGDILWLGSNGAFTKTKATAPDHLVFVGVVVRATNNGIVYVATQNGYELDELHNVSIPSPSPGDFLKYNGSLWVNDAINLGTDTVGSYVESVAVSGVGLSVTGSGESASVTVTSNATDANTPSTIVSRDGSGNFSAGTITASLSGNASTASTLQNARTISLGGDLSGSASFNGSSDITISATVQPNSVALGTDTTGNYMSGVSAGTGISVSHTPGEGSTATIGLNANLDDLLDVNVTSASVGHVLTYNGANWVSASASGGGANVTVSTTPPASPSEGDLWFESDTTRTFVYYDSFWVEVGSTGAGATTSDTAPTNPVQGQFWFNSLNGATYVYYGTVWLEVGAVPVNTLLSTIQAKGDLLVGTAAATVDNLGAGTTGQVLTVDPSTATGLKWADSQGGGGLNTSTDGVFITMAIGM